MISSGKRRRARLRAMTIALLSLVALLAASSFAFAKVGLDSNVVSSAGKRTGVDEMIRARTQTQRESRRAASTALQKHQAPQRTRRLAARRLESGSPIGGSGTAARVGRRQRHAVETADGGDQTSDHPDHPPATDHR